MCSMFSIKGKYKQMYFFFLQTSVTIFRVYIIAFFELKQNWQNITFVKTLFLEND